jgi:crooked neck
MNLNQGQMRVKNRAPAPVQITAEQILREAREVQGDEFVAPKSRITDPEEMQMFRMTKRKEYEDSIRRQRQHMGTWMKYAKWEESQSEIQRARSIFERALDVEYKNKTIWLRYAEMEMRNKYPNRARNVWDRAVTLLPRVDQFWYKYAFMEEMLENISGSRLIFERWMKWEPDEHAWMSYVKFEERQAELDHCRRVLERYVACHPVAKSYLKYGSWEERNGERSQARKIYEAALEELEDDEKSEHFYLKFARFETRCSEQDRARVIYRYALDHLPKAEASELYKDYIAFEKQNGDRTGIEEAVIAKRRLEYEDSVRDDPLNYDTWFDYTRLEESAAAQLVDDPVAAPAALGKVREVYERAIANVPPAEEKRYWRRYIYLWLNYAVFEEVQAEDVGRARAVYKQCLEVIPHESFTFGKIWVGLAHLEVRAMDLGAARRTLGQAIGRCPKEKLFKSYIQLEMQLGEIDRCRTLYGKSLEWAPHDCTTWTRYAALEQQLEEDERCRGIYELAIGQPLLDMPELLWKAFIDFEIGRGEWPRARQLYERLLERTRHVKVWVSYAKMEADRYTGGGGGEGGGEEEEEEDVLGGPMDRAREILGRGAKDLKEADAGDRREERALLLDEWVEVEEGAAKKAREGGDGAGEEACAESVTKVKAMMPKKIKKKRLLTDDAGNEAGWEEYVDFVFPEDKKATPNLKILEMAQKWKAMQAAAAGGGGEDAGTKRKADDM